MYGVLGALEGKQTLRFRQVEKKKRPSRARRCCRKFSVWCRNWCNKTNKTLLVLGATLGLPAFYMTLWLLLSPGLSTLAAHFHPASCTVASSVVLEGINNCSWSSCRQGCTLSELYLCWQVFVFVQVLYENQSSPARRRRDVEDVRPLPVPVTPVPGNSVSPVTPVSVNPVSLPTPVDIVSPITPVTSASPITPVNSVKSISSVSVTPVISSSSATPVSFTSPVPDSAPVPSLSLMKNQSREQVKKGEGTVLSVTSDSLMRNQSEKQVKDGGDKLTLSPVTSPPPKKNQSRGEQVKRSENSTISPDSFTKKQSKEQVKEKGEDRLTSSPVTLPPPKKNQSREEQVNGNKDNLTPSPVSSRVSPPVLPSATPTTLSKSTTTVSTLTTPVTPSTPSTFTPQSQEPQTNTKEPDDDLNPDEMGFLLPKGPGSLTRLRINVEGCGYDSCDTWWQQYGRLGSTYTCYLSADGSIAVPEVDLEEAKTKVVLGMLPLVLMTVAVVVLYVFYWPKKSNRRKDNPKKVQEVKWEQARHLILKQIEKKNKPMQFDPLLVKEALRSNQVAPSTLAVKGGKKR
ncbi:uncharacterized protein LOC135091054 [Scylla paramamosain]|uniref:uncharacterized protein LOC135091054 n=1 Tax=Scylla paramamosain TaxID=85552 RepID=UPI003083BB60